MGILNSNQPHYGLLFLPVGELLFFEYIFQVPANRIGHEFFSAAQLKIMQEAITIIVFCVFSILYLKEDLKWNYLVGFTLILLAVFLFSKNGIKNVQKLIALPSLDKFKK